MLNCIRKNLINIKKTIFFNHTLLEFAFLKNKSNKNKFNKKKQIENYFTQLYNNLHINVFLKNNSLCYENKFLQSITKKLFLNLKNNFILIKAVLFYFIDFYSIGVFKLLSFSTFYLNKIYFFFKQTYTRALVFYLQTLRIKINSCLSEVRLFFTKCFAFINLFFKKITFYLVKFNKYIFTNKTVFYYCNDWRKLLNLYYKDYFLEVYALFNELNSSFIFQKNKVRVAFNQLSQTFHEELIQHIKRLT